MTLNRNGGKKMLTFTAITENDIHELAQLFIETFNANPWNEHWTTQTAEKRLSQMIHVESFFGLKAFDQGKLCGLILGCFEQYDNGPNFYLREFCVKNTLQGKGIGTAILKTLEEHLIQKDVKEIYLCTARKSTAELFYKKHHYQEDQQLCLLSKSL